MKPGDGLVELAGILGPERLGQELDVGSPVPKGGEHEADHADAMIELLAKPALLDQGGQVFAGGHDEPGVSRWWWMAGAGLVVAKLQLAEQIELKFERQRCHFVEIERAAVGLGQLVGPLAGVHCPRRDPPARPARRLDGSSAIADASTVMKGRSGAGPEQVDQPGQERLARSGLADDQDRGPRRGDRGGQVDDLAPARICADQADLPSDEVDALRPRRGRRRHCSTR